MINLLKALVILGLVSMLVGGGAGAYYFLVQQPRAQDEKDARVSGPAGQPTPDPTTPEFEKIRDLRHNQQYAEAHAATEAFLTRFPESTHRDEAETMLGELNVIDLLANAPGPDKVEYIVQRGDVLDRVAHKTKCNQELLFQANGLERTMLRIGQKLRVPQVDMAVEIHLKQRKLVLLNHGRFFKSYAIQNGKQPPAKKFPDIHTKVQEKQAKKDGRQVAFGTKDYPGSVRSLSLAGQPAYTISGEEESPDKPPVAGIGLSLSDAEEMHMLVSVGTPVTINGD